MEPNCQRAQPTSATLRACNVGFCGVSLSLTAMLFAWVAIRGVPVSLGLVWFCVSLPFVAIVLGRAVLHFGFPHAATQAASDPDGLLSFALGVLILNLALMLAAFLVPGDIRIHYAAVCLLALGTWWATAPIHLDGPDNRMLRFAVLLFLFAAVSMHLYYPLRLYRVGEQAVTFTAYKDIFIHAKTIAMFSDGPEAFTYRSIRGIPIPAYHYASYLLAALFRSLTGASALESAVCVWLPLGFLTMAGSAYAVGRAIGGLPGSILALACVLILPDGSVWPTSHSHLSFFAYTRISPAMPYAIAQGLIALYFVWAGARQRKPMLVCMGLVCALLTAAVKMQVAIFLLPVASAFAVLDYPAVLWTRRVQILAGLSVLGLAALALLFKVAPWLGTVGESGFQDYLDYLFRTARPHDRVFTFIRDRTDTPLGAFLGLGLVPVATFGVLLPWYVILVANQWRRGRFCAADLLPSVFIALYVVTIVLWPAASRTPYFEFQHRPHVFFYAMLATYCGGRSGTLLQSFLPRLPSSLLSVGLPLILAVSLVVPWVTKEHYQERCHATRLRGTYDIPRGLWDAAIYIREHAGAAEAFADSQSDPWGIATGLTDIQALRSRIAMITRPGSWKEGLEESAQTQESLERATSGRALREFAREKDVRWYLLHPDDRSKLQWPPDVLASPVFQSHGYAVFDLFAVE